MRTLLVMLLFTLSGCVTPSATQTRGGSILLTQGQTRIEVMQPSNPDETATITYTFATGETVSATTGSSREDTIAKLGLELNRYQIFTYVGAAVCALGLGITIASFWFPLIPKLAGPLMFGGGALTAYMSTAIPDYGPYFLVISLIGAVAWFYHQSAGKKDPATFKKGSNSGS